ncbi:LysM domain-containing protein [Streptomyces sp. NPDC006622]|uniref:LysM domain-containing protein n=1 Tax=Streptomyces sp. NPDC006622 TaxID=3155459 RepID=UPI0033B88720
MTLPAPVPTPVEPPAPATPTTPAEQGCTHTVVSGETLSAIASRYVGGEGRHPEIYARPTRH